MPAAVLALTTAQLAGQFHAVVRPRAVDQRYLCRCERCLPHSAAVLQGAGGPQQLRKLRRQLTTQSGASMASTRSALYSGGLNVRVDSMARSVDSDSDAHRPLLSGPRPSPVPSWVSPQCNDDYICHDVSAPARLCFPAE